LFGHVRVVFEVRRGYEEGLTVDGELALQLIGVGVAADVLVQQLRLVV
jgi:hypothetical protein